MQPSQKVWRGPAVLVAAHCGRARRLRRTHDSRYQVAREGHRRHETSQRRNQAATNQQEAVEAHRPAARVPSEELVRAARVGVDTLADAVDLARSSFVYRLSAASRNSRVRFHAARAP